jgi:hypothetical protein
MDWKPYLGTGRKNGQHISCVNNGRYVIKCEGTAMYSIWWCCYNQATKTVIDDIIERGTLDECKEFADHHEVMFKLGAN